jgi:hypothetical protein
MEVYKMITGVLGIQIVGILFGLMMLYVSFMHSKRKEFSGKETIFWMITWIIFIFVSIFPYSLDFFAKEVLNMSRTMDFLIIIGFVFVTGLLFYSYGVTLKNQRKIEQVVRTVAMQNVKNKKEK